MAATQVVNVPDFSAEDLSLNCNTDLSALQYKAVKLSSNEVVVAGSGDQASGILQNAPNTTGTNASPIAKVRAHGYSKYVTGGAITSGQFLKPNTNGDGTLIAATVDHDKYCAIAIGDADSGVIAACVLAFGTISAA